MATGAEFSSRPGAGRRLFVGDAVNNVHIVTGQPGAQVAPGVANTSTGQAYESLSRIEELEARTLYFGHGDPIDARHPRDRRRGPRQTLTKRGHAIAVWYARVAHVIVIMVRATRTRKPLRTVQFMSIPADSARAA